MKDIQQALFNYHVRGIHIDKGFEDQSEETLRIILRQYELLAKFLNPAYGYGPDITIGYPTDKRFGAECTYDGRISILPSMAGYYLHEYFHYLDRCAFIKDSYLYKNLAERLRQTQTMQDFFEEYPETDGRTKRGKHRKYFSNDKEVLARYFNDFIVLIYGNLAEIPGYQLEFTEQDVRDHARQFCEMISTFTVYAKGVPVNLDLMS